MGFVSHMLNEKGCTKCGELKPLDCFYRYPSGQVDSQCRDCKRSYMNSPYKKALDATYKERKRKGHLRNRIPLEEYSLRGLATCDDVSTGQLGGKVGHSGRLGPAEAGLENARYVDALQCSDLEERDGLIVPGREPWALEVTKCIMFDGLPAKWRFRAAHQFYVDTGVNQSLFSWPTPVCGTEFCIASTHLTWVSPKRLCYPEAQCIYCGIRATDFDHLLPRTWTGEALRRYVINVPACRQCNTAISDLYVPSITERRRVAHHYITRKYKKQLAIPEWSRQELRQLGHTLRSFVDRGLFDRNLAQARLAWPEFKDYDLRAAQLAGIEDPYAVGLLS